MSLIKIIKYSGINTDPRGTPKSTFLTDYIVLFIRVLRFLSNK